MRAIGVHEDVIVVESRVWRTTATIVRSGDEAFVIDSPVLPDELELLPALLEQARFPFSGLLATHGDWDHLLGRLAFPGARARGRRDDRGAAARATPAGRSGSCATSTSATTSSARRRSRSARVEALPVPGYCGLGERELELHPADGHTVDGMAIWIPWAGVLVCGDYLSPVEIPTPGGVDRRLSGDAGAARAAGRRAPSTSFPATAARSTRRRAAALLAEDRAYLEALRASAPRGAAAAPARPSSDACTRPTRAAARRRERSRELSDSGRPMKTSRPCRCPWALLARREAERLVERDRGGVVLVGVELDPPRAARAGALEGGARRARAPTPRPRARSST